MFALCSLLLACATLNATGTLDQREISRGDEVRYSITLCGRVLLPVAGHIVTLPPGEHMATAVPLRNAFFLRPSLLYWERTFELTLRCGHRGRWQVAPHALLLQDIFGIPEPDPLKRAASHVDGVASIMTGISANKSIATGMPVKVDELLGRKISDLKKTEKK